MRAYVLPLILAIFTGLALLVGMMFFAKPSGVYYKYTGSDTKVKAYPVILYYDKADGKVTPKVYVELQNLGTTEATYFIKYENETKDVSLSEEGSVKVEVALSELNRDEPKFVTKYVSIYKNGQDESNLIVKVPVFLIVDTAPVIETNHIKFPKFIIAQRSEESLIFYVDVDDSKAISNVTITLANTTPITITGIHYSDVLLNNNVWEMLQTFILLTFPIFAILTNVVNWNLEILIITPALLVSIGVISLVDASITNILEVANNRNPDYLRILLNSLQIIQGLILVFMRLYYTNGFWAGEYYKKLLNFLTISL